MMSHRGTVTSCHGTVMQPPRGVHNPSRGRHWCDVRGKRHEVDIQWRDQPCDVTLPSSNVTPHQAVTWSGGGGRPAPRPLPAGACRAPWPACQQRPPAQPPLPEVDAASMATDRKSLTAPPSGEANGTSRPPEETWSCPGVEPARQ